MITINQETKKNILRSVLFFSLTGVMIFIIFRFGLSTAVKISEFFQKKNTSSDTVPLDSYLPAPKLVPVAETTNMASLEISGYGPANKEVVIYLNGFEDQSVPLDSEGKFTAALNLTLGVNNFYAVVKDFSGNLSAQSDTLTIYYSNLPPSIEILEPTEGSIIKNNPSVTIKGKTEPSSKVYINDHLVLLDDEGNFSYAVKLVRGTNAFKVVATDLANNYSEKEFSYEFRP